MAELSNDITQELAMLHTFTGADFIAKLRQIAGRGEFHPIEDEKNIYTVG